MTEPKDEAKEKDKAERGAKAAAKAGAEGKSGGAAKLKDAPKRKPAKKPAAKKPAAKPKAKPEPKREKVAEPEAPVIRARARYLRVSPRKVRLVADTIRGLEVTEARSLLQFSSRGAARDLAKLLDSAIANTENNHDLVADDMRITEIAVDDGPTLRRWRPRAQGRATRINKRTSHVSVALTPIDD